MEWEILVLNGLSRLANIGHEASVGKRFPDVLARLGTREAVESLVADITTVFADANEGLNITKGSALEIPQNTGDAWNCAARNFKGRALGYG